MERTFRIKEVNGDTAFQDQTLVVEKKKINLLIVLELGGTTQFSRTYNDLWTVKKLDSLANLKEINNLGDSYEFENICIVHHGNIFSDTSKGKNNRAILFSNKIREIKLVISKLGEVPVTIDDAYALRVFEKSKLLFSKNGPDELKIKACLGLKNLINRLPDGGTFISVACKEANDSEFLKELADFTTKNIQLFGNTNYSLIDDGSDYKYNKLVLYNYRSILNTYLSTAWQNQNGWMYYDTGLKKLVLTKKELWLYSTGEKIFALFNRKKELTREQIDRDHYAQLYFSKEYEKFHKKNVNTITYENWKKQMEKKYSDFKPAVLNPKK
jgi:hypothetical protein